MDRHDKVSVLNAWQNSKTSHADGRWWSGTVMSHHDASAAVCRLLQGRPITSCVASIQDRRRPGRFFQCTSRRSIALQLIQRNSAVAEKPCDAPYCSESWYIPLLIITFAKGICHRAFSLCLLALATSHNNYVSDLHHENFIIDVSLDKEVMRIARSADPDPGSEPDSPWRSCALRSSALVLCWVLYCAGWPGLTNWRMSVTK